MRSWTGLVFVVMILGMACTSSPTNRPTADIAVDATIAAAVEATVAALPTHTPILATKVPPAPTEGPQVSMMPTDITINPPTPTISAPGGGDRLAALVTRVIDGDTVEVNP